MRIWDVDPAILCRAHLLGEHRELHAIWTILSEDRIGYRSHPETIRWEGRLAALHRRHEILVHELVRRGYNHRSPLDRALATGDAHQPLRVDAESVQLAILRAKPCPCTGADWPDR